MADQVRKTGMVVARVPHMMHVYTDYEVFGYREKSTGFKVRVILGTMCPVCGAVLPELVHGEPRVCKCSRRLTRFGNGLLVEEEQENECRTV